MTTAIFDFREMARVEAIWWVGGQDGEPGAMEGDWMACIYRPIGDLANIVIKYRFRYYKDDKAFHSDDQKNVWEARVSAREAIGVDHCPRRDRKGRAASIRRQDLPQAVPGRRYGRHATAVVPGPTIRPHDDASGVRPDEASVMTIYLAVAGATAIGYLNWAYYACRGKFENPEEFIFSALASLLVGLAWPMLAAVAPAWILLARKRRAAERRRILATPIEKLGEEP